MVNIRRNLLSYRFGLPLAQVLLAFSVMIYGPHELRVAMEKTHAGGNLGWLSEHDPPPSERISSAVNFPARVLNYPFHWWTSTIYERPFDYTYVLFEIQDVSYLIWIAIFWSWLGTWLDRRAERSEKTDRARRFLVAESALGVILGVHCCPVKSRTESIGCWDRVSQCRRLMLEVPVKWAFSRKG